MSALRRDACSGCCWRLEVVQALMGPSFRWGDGFGASGGCSLHPGKLVYGSEGRLPKHISMCMHHLFCSVYLGGEVRRAGGEFNAVVRL